MKKTIILNAGHDAVGSPGAVYNGTTESKEVIILRDKLKVLLKQQFEVVCVPDNLNLVESIQYVNHRYKKLDDGFAFSIHLNAGGEGKASGAETYFYGGFNSSEKIAKTILYEYCKITGYKNRGERADTTTRFKRLGWIRDITIWSCLIECCFIDNLKDITKLQNNYDLVAWGMYVGICKSYGIKPTKLKVDTKKDLIVEIKSHINQINKLIQNYESSK